MFPLEAIKGGEKGEGKKGGRVEGETGGGRNRRKEGEEEGGSIKGEKGGGRYMYRSKERERRREGQGRDLRREGKGRMALVVCKLIAYLCGYCLATTHNMHMQCTCCCLPPTAEPEIWCCPHRPLLSLCHKLQYGVPPNSSPVACGPSPEDSTLIWLGTSGACGC